MRVYIVQYFASIFILPVGRYIKIYFPAPVAIVNEKWINRKREFIIL